MDSSSNFDPNAIIALADAEDSLLDPEANKEMKEAIQAEIERGIRCVQESTKKYSWIGGLFFTEEWMPYMSAILDTLFPYLKQLRADRRERCLNYTDLLVMVSVVHEVRTCINEKNQRIESQIAKQDLARRLPFEPINHELYRKTGEIVQLSRLCTFLDLFLDGENARANHRRRENNLIYFLTIARRHRSGELSDDNIVCLMPAVADEHIQFLLLFKKKLEMLGEEHKVLLNLVKSDVIEMAQKMMKELVTMTAYLQTNGYSKNWRNAIITKIDDLRPIIERGGTGAELKEAIQYLNFQYYRIRNAYEKKKEMKENPPSMDKGKRGA